MLCKCGKLFSHNYKAYCCSELKVRIPLYLPLCLFEDSSYVENEVSRTMQSPPLVHRVTQIQERLSEDVN